MESLATTITRSAGHAPSPGRPEPRLRLLLADDDARVRSVIASCARETVGGLEVIEAADGAEAIELGLERRPQLALVDVNMPRVGGIEVALTLRDAEPRMRLALHTADPRAHRDGARVCRLPLFDKLQPGRVLAWLETQALSAARVRRTLRPVQARSRVCSRCGYGIARAAPPQRCPMCQTAGAWSETLWRPFGRGVEAAC